MTTSTAAATTGVETTAVTIGTIVEVVIDDLIFQAVMFPEPFQLNQETIPQILRPYADRIEGLDDT